MGAVFAEERDFGGDPAGGYRGIEDYEDGSAPDEGGEMTIIQEELRERLEEIGEKIDFLVEHADLSVEVKFHLGAAGRMVFRAQEEVENGL